jgi:hypothetical protein
LPGSLTGLVVGILDRLAQGKKRESHKSENAVCFENWVGFIDNNYIHNGEKGIDIMEKISLNQNISSWNIKKVEVKVELGKGRVTFAITDKKGKNHKQIVNNKILS